MEKIQNIPLFLILLFSGAVIFSVLINSIFLRFAKTLGIRNNPEMQIRWSATVKPSIGGISFYVIFLFSFILLEILFGKTYSYFADRKLIGVLLVSTLAFIMGLADDAFDTRPLFKFLTQFVCAIVLILTGTYVQCFNSEFLNYGITILWVIGIMNSLNMLDNMDAITTSVSIIILGFCIYCNIVNGLVFNPMNFLAVCMMGTLGGFLIFNWHPSQMFMGDTGSQFLGALIGILGIEFCWNVQTFNEFQLPVIYPSKGILMVALVFIIPLCDTATVVINRLSKGKSPFVGGKDHTTHQLFFKGLTEKRIAIFFIMINVLACVLAYFVAQQIHWEIGDFLLYSTFPLTVFLFLFINTRIKKSIL